jgi:hypothetical protein
VPDTAWKRDSLQMIIFVNVCSTWSMVEVKTRFETWVKWNDVNGVSLFHFSYLITLMASPCSERTPNVQIKFCMFERSIYRSFVPNTSWKRESLQIMIFVYVCSTWNVVELKTRFETWITRNDVKGVSFYHISYLITFTSYLCSQRKPKLKSILLLLIGRSTDYLCFIGAGNVTLQIMIFVYVCSTKHSWNKNTFLEVNKKKWRKWCKFVHLLYLITLMPSLCSQRAPNVQIKIFMFVRSIYRTFGPYTGWKRDPLQMINIKFARHESYLNYKRVLRRDNTKWRKWCKFVTPFLFSNTYGLPVLTMDNKCPNQSFYLCLAWTADYFCQIGAGNLTLSK